MLLGMGFEHSAGWRVHSLHFGLTPWRDVEGGKPGGPLVAEHWVELDMVCFPFDLVDLLSTK